MATGTTEDATQQEVTVPSTIKGGSESGQRVESRQSRKHGQHIRPALAQ